MRSIIVICLVILAVNGQAQNITPGSFGLEVPKKLNCTPVKDQYMSSTCWSFASLSFFESEILRMGDEEVDLSEMFIARYSMLRKIDRHLKLKGMNYFTPGGQFHDVAWVIRNHGIVPESAYDGKPGGALVHNHAELDTVLTHYINKLVKDGVVELNFSRQQFIDSILDHYLGKVPDEFEYRGTIYTPFSFRERVFKLRMNDYVEISSYTHHPFYESFVLEDKYNWTGDSYINVPVADFSFITDYALEHAYTVGWDGDADDPDFNFNAGLAFLPGSINDYTRQRQEDYISGTTTLNHLMHIVGKVKDRFGKNWYYIKNSWGDYSNLLGGFLFMQEDYFRLRTVAVIVNKNALPPAIRAKLGL
jgi:bleomycin hydrolase